VLPANALELGFRASATAGLDGPTRQLLENMPENIRKEALKLIEDAKPLIDDSVHAYLAQVDLIIASRVDHVACKTVGTVYNITDRLEELLRGRPPGTASRVRAEWENHWTAFRAKSTPDEIATRYADFLAYAYNSRCAVSNVQEASAEIAQLELHAARRWNVWNRLKGSCTTLDACHDVMAAAVPMAIAAADARDRVTAARLIESAKGIKKPEPQRWFAFSFDLRPHEEQVLLMASIVDGIETARVERIAEAQRLREHVLEWLRSHEEKRASRVPARGTTVTKEKNDRMIAVADEIEKEAEKMFGYLRRSQKKDETFAEGIEQIRKNVEALVKRAARNKTHARELNALLEQRILGRPLPLKYP
jgi:hypothetical protein